jgi:hypothetical protein
MRNGSKEDLQQEYRRSRILALYSKNLTQSEIAQELKVDQSTVSRDLRHIKDEAKNKVIEVSDNLSFEYIKFLAANSEIIRELWDIAGTDPLNNSRNDSSSNNTIVDPNTMISINMNNKNRIAALTLLLEANKQHIEIITGGTRSTRDQNGITIMSHGHEMKQAMKTPTQLRHEKEEENIRLLSQI